MDNYRITINIFGWLFFGEILNNVVNYCVQITAQIADESTETLVDLRNGAKA